MFRTALALLFLLLFALAAQGLAADMAAKVQQSCAGCHSLGLLCDKAGGDPAYWRETVARMADSGAQVESAEVGPMAAYLAGLAKAQAPVCK
mgnify:FL=1